MDRLQELLQYMHQLTHLTDEPIIDVTERLERVCDEIEKKINIEKSTNIGKLTVTLDAKEFVKDLKGEIEKLERRKDRLSNR